MIVDNVNHTCPQCFAKQTLFVQTRHENGKGYSIWNCRRCGFGETFPHPDEDALHALHSLQYYRTEQGDRFIKPIEFLIGGMRRWRVRRLARHVNIGRALDIGCGSGRFLLDLRRVGWEVAGLELNSEIAGTLCGLHGFTVETSLEAFSDEFFDLITITHVLEHVRDPRWMLMQCFRLLRPGGIIAVTVPNIHSWQARLTGEHWFHLDVPRHLWHFSERWLSKTLHDLGFAQVAVRRLDIVHNTFGWLQSLLNMMGLRHNRLYTFLIGDDLKDENMRPFGAGLFASIILSPFLLPLSFMLAVIESSFHAGGTVEIIARMPVCRCPGLKH